MLCDRDLDVLDFILGDEMDDDPIDIEPPTSSSCSPSSRSPSQYELVEEEVKIPMTRKTHLNDPVPEYLIFTYDWERGATIIDNHARYWSVDWHNRRGGHPWERCFAGFKLFPAHKLKVFVPDSTIKFLLMEMQIRRPELTTTTIVAMVNEDNHCEECDVGERCHRLKALRIYERLNLNGPKWFIPHS